MSTPALDALARERDFLYRPGESVTWPESVARRAGEQSVVLPLPTIGPAPPLPNQTTPRARGFFYLPPPRSEVGTGRCASRRKLLDLTYNVGGPASLLFANPGNDFSSFFLGVASLPYGFILPHFTYRSALTNICAFCRGTPNLIFVPRPRFSGNPGLGSNIFTIQATHALIIMMRFEARTPTGP
jgi:hypothetical protein